MKSSWKIAVLVSCLSILCLSVIAVHFVKVRRTHQKLAELAKTCRKQAQLGDAKAQYDLARMYYYGRGVPHDDREAVGWYRKAADQGNPEAEFGLAFMYREGKGVPQEPDQAIDWCRQAAEHGYARAEYALGNTYHDGWHVSQDNHAAIAWYRRAAEQGYAGAQDALGYMYSQGQGVPQNDSEAVDWYRKAAEQGNAHAQGALGFMYFAGKGVKPDSAQAARWFREGAKQGDEYSRRALSARKVRLDTFSKICLLVAFLGSAFLLMSSKGETRNPERRRLLLAGLLGLLWVGLDVYGNFRYGLLEALSAVNPFYFGKSLLSGIAAVLILSIVWPQPRFKIVLTACAMLFVGFNMYAAMHYDLRHFAACPRAFYSANGLLIGIAMTSAWFLRHSDNSAVKDSPISAQ